PAAPRHVPPLGQRRLDLGGRPLVPHEPVEDLPGDAGRDPVGDDCWIQLHGLTLSAEHEGLAERRTRGDLEGNGDEERERCEPHGPVLPKRPRRGNRLVAMRHYRSTTRFVKCHAVWPEDATPRRRRVSSGATTRGP